MSARVAAQTGGQAFSSRRPIRRVGNWRIAPLVIRGAVSRALADPAALRARLLKPLWIELKRFAAPRVVSVDLWQISGLDRIRVEGTVLRRSPLVVCALASLLEAETIFEFGTYHGETAWLLARNLPHARVLTLDLEGQDAVGRAALELTDLDEYFREWGRGSRFRDTPEAERITQLIGDSATFDFAPYGGSVDLVYVDASHSYSYVRSDTEAGLAMLSPSGTIVWDDYTHYSGIFAYLHELAPTLDRPIYHLVGTRLAVYSRRPLVEA